MCELPIAGGIRSFRLRRPNVDGTTIERLESDGNEPNSRHNSLPSLLPQIQAEQIYYMPVPELGGSLAADWVRRMFPNVNVDAR
jgi:hypothetical protein